MYPFSRQPDKGVHIIKHPGLMYSNRHFYNSNRHSNRHFLFLKCRRMTSFQQIRKLQRLPLIPVNLQLPIRCYYHLTSQSSIEISISPDSVRIIQFPPLPFAGRSTSPDEAFASKLFVVFNDPVTLPSDVLSSNF